MTRPQRKLASQVLYVAGILLSLATFILQALPVSWGIFLSAARFIIGSVFWPGWEGVDERSKS